MRLENWELRLSEFIESRRDTPFEWGGNDCVGFAASAVEAMTGESPVKVSLRYRTALGARRALAAAGFGSIDEAVTTTMGWPLSSPLFARRGDIALAAGDQVTPGEREALGVVVGSRVAFPAEQGLEFLPVSSVLRAWRIS